MKVIVCKDYEEMSLRSARIVAAQITVKPNCLLGFATGSTPVGMYHKLAEMNRAGKIDFAEVKTVNLDEYYPIDPANDQSYRYFMNKNLFDNINIKKENTNVPDGQAKDTEAEGNRYEALIASLGGIDLQVLGIGRNGHIGFNEPDSFLYNNTHVTGLTADTINANARFFASEDDVPKHALTMGIGTILRAKKIIILINGKNKHEALTRMLEGKLDPMCPASMLNVHPDVTVLCDEEAYNG